MPTISLKTADVAALLAAERWWEPDSLRRLLSGQPASVLGHDAGPDPSAPTYAFLATDAPSVRRFFVVLRGRGILEFDQSTGPGAVEWRLEGAAGRKLSHRRVLPKTNASASSPLNLLVPPGADVEPVFSMDLAGARVDQDVVLFHSGMGMAATSLFFDVAGKGTLRFLVAGLSPGFWEVWRDGFLEDTPGRVMPGKGTLYYESEPGGYFLRRQ